METLLPAMHSMTPQFVPDNGRAQFQSSPVNSLNVVARISGLSCKETVSAACGKPKEWVPARLGETPGDKDFFNQTKGKRDVQAMSRVCSQQQSSLVGRSATSIPKNPAQLRPVTFSVV